MDHSVGFALWAIAHYLLYGIWLCAVGRGIEPASINIWIIYNVYPQALAMYSHACVDQHGHASTCMRAVDACAEYGSAQWASAQSSVMHYGLVSRITIQGLYFPWLILCLGPLCRFEYLGEDKFITALGYVTGDQVGSSNLKNSELKHLVRLYL